jgi:hypothetical protein
MRDGPAAGLPTAFEPKPRDLAYTTGAAKRCTPRGALEFVTALVLLIICGGQMNGGSAIR